MPFISSVRGSWGPQGKTGRTGSGIKTNITGGTVTTAGGYRIHSFTTTGASTFDPTLFGYPLSVEILMVGGGGAAGTYAGGGGGGEVLSISRQINGALSYPLNVGAGGVGDTGAYSTTKHGGQTTGFSETAKGGGSAKSSDDTVFQNTVNPDVGNGGGGSSRSAGYFGSVGTSVGTGVTRFGGNRGGQTLFSGTSTNQSPNFPGGGGGGAGASVNGDTGGTTSANSAGNGGIGVQNSILGTNYYWAGGGGGGLYYNSPATTAGSGGLGGGGGAGNVSAGSGGGSALNPGSPGSTSSPFNGGPGGANTGGGAGAGRGETTGSGGNGGSGIIVVRYLL